MPLNNEEEYERALNEIEGFIANPPEAGTHDASKFVDLLKDVEDYEDKNYPVAANDAQVVVYEINGIRCDGPQCDFRDDSVSVNDYPEWVDRPCPKCGTNLLTQADFEEVSKFIFYADTINEIAAGGGLGLDRVTDRNADNLVTLDIGSGFPPRAK